MPQIRRKGTLSTTIVAEGDPRLDDSRYVRVDLPRSDKGKSSATPAAASAHRAAVADSIDDTEPDED